MHAPVSLNFEFVFFLSLVTKYSCIHTVVKCVPEFRQKHRPLFLHMHMHIKKQNKKKVGSIDQMHHRPGHTFDNLCTKNKHGKLEANPKAFRERENKGILQQR